MDAREKVEMCRMERDGQAHDRANACWNREMFANAIASLGKARRARLVNDALALCGSPYYVLSHIRWSQAAWEFLALFCD